ncbi:MAG: hypothetical protein RBU45_09860 [Myxococcota bacterium]|jgi:hypothetical protein|nr:hypothetical protein [Myxococcota bacterium]
MVGAQETVLGPRVRTGILLGTAWLGLLVGTGCAADQETVAPAAAECPGLLEGASCLKACGLAVETLSLGGLSYGASFTVQAAQGEAQPVSSPEAWYTPERFFVSARSLALELTHDVLSDLHAGRTSPPVCVHLSSPGEADGFAQYLPGSSTFTTNTEHTGTAALLAYAPETGVVKGIFQFEAVLAKGTGGDTTGPEDRITIRDGYFRAQMR